MHRGAVSNQLGHVARLGDSLVSRPVSPEQRTKARRPIERGPEHAPEAEVERLLDAYWATLLVQVRGMRSTHATGIRDAFSLLDDYSRLEEAVLPKLVDRASEARAGHREHEGISRREGDLCFVAAGHLYHAVVVGPMLDEAQAAGAWSRLTHTVEARRIARRKLQSEQPADWQ